MNPSTTYQLPTIYSQPERRKNFRRLFVFQNTNLAGVRAAVEMIANAPAVEYVEVRCAEELTDVQLADVEAIFEELIPQDRDIEIVFDTDIPDRILRAWFIEISNEIILRRAVLN